MNATKKCSKCGEVKAVELFGKNKTKKDGMQSDCKECAKTAWIGLGLKHKEKIATYRANRKLNNPEKVLEGSRKWANNNREKINEKYKKNRDELSDSYVRSTLSMSALSATPELIELKRTQLQIIRLTREIKNELHTKID